MSAILEIPEIRERISRLSVGEYHRLDEFNARGRRTELIRGIVLEKTPCPPLHCTLRRRLYDAINQSISAGLIALHYNPLTLADSEPEPDISVVRGTENDFVSAHPSTAELVIEVAVGSASLDRENASLYAEAGVKEYWIVLGEARQIEVYQNPVAGRYQRKRLASVQETLRCESVPAIEVKLAALFG